MTQAYAWTTANINLLDTQDKETNSAYPWLYLQENNPGLQTWIIKDNTAYPWPDEDTGQFYQNNIFIILSISRSSIGHTKDVYLWLGKYSSQVDYIAGTSLVTQLYNLLSNHVSLHREVQGREDTHFLQLFKPIVYWKGSHENSYRNSLLTRRGYKVRMLQLHRPDDKPNAIIAKEVACNIKELDPAYTFILDTGDCVYMWQGDLTSTKEDVLSIRFFERLRASRGGGIKSQILNEEHIEGHPFFSFLSTDSYKRDNGEYCDEDRRSTLHRKSLMRNNNKIANRKSRLIKIHYDAKRASRKKRLKSPTICQQFEMRNVKNGSLSPKDLTDDSILIYDVWDKLWLWYSKNALPVEKKLALQYVHTMHNVPLLMKERKYCLCLILALTEVSEICSRKNCSCQTTPEKL